MLTGTFAPYYGGGAKQALSLCGKLRERGFSPFVVTKHWGNGEPYKENIHGVNVFRLDWGRSPIQRMLYSLRVLRFLLTQRKNYEIIHSHGIFPYTYCGIIASKLHGKKIIAKMITSGADDPKTIKNRFLGSLQLKLLSLIDKIVSISSELSASFKQSSLPQNKLIEIPNGVDTDKFKPLADMEKHNLRKSLRLPTDQIIFTFVGVLNKRKGSDLLIEAWRKIAQDIPKAKLILVGPKTKTENKNTDEQFVNNLLDEIKTNPLMKNVILTGYIDNAQEYLKASDIFVFPSWREGMPNSLLEAMSCGILCIASELPCVTDIITNNQNGLLFPPGDVKQLADLMIKTAKDSKLRDATGSNARDTIECKFSLDIVADRYAILYRQLLAEKSRRTTYAH